MTAESTHTTSQAQGADQGGKRELSFMERHFSLGVDLWNFFKVKNRWWLIPVIFTFLIVGVLIVLGQSSSLSPLIYALF